MRDQKTSSDDFTGKASWLVEEDTMRLGPFVHNLGGECGEEIRQHMGPYVLSVIYIYIYIYTFK